MHNYEDEKQSLERELKRINYRLKIVKDLIEKRKALSTITPDYVIDQYIKAHRMP